MSDPLFAIALDHQVTNQNAYEDAAEIMVGLRQELVALDKCEAAELAPVLAEAATIRDRYDSDRRPIKEADADLLGRMELYQDVAAENGVAVKRAASTTTRTRWSAEVVDLRALAEAVLDELVPLRFLQANQKELNKVARSEHEAMTIPGVEAKGRTSIGVSAL